jgi:transcriptional regulator with XRE-family HTH domain
MKYKLRYNVRRIREDMARRGWMASHLGAACGLSVMTITRFLNRECQTAKTGHKIATALGATVDRYLVTSEKRTAA